MKIFHENEKNYENYLFISAKISSLETKIIKNDVFAEMVFAKTEREYAQLLEKNKIRPVTETFGEKNYEIPLHGRLKTAYDEIYNITKEPELLSFFTYPRDCKNIKIAIKHYPYHSFPPDFMHLPGSVAPEKLLSAVSNKSYDIFPPNMASTLENIIRTRSDGEMLQPSVLTALDKACFKDISDCIEKKDKKSRFRKIERLSFIREILRFKIDAINLMTAFRLRENPNLHCPMHKAYLPGGSYDADFFKNIITNFENITENELNVNPYMPIYDIFAGGFTIRKIEKIFDDLLMKLVLKSKSVVSGIEKVFGYLYGMDTEIKNLKIIFAGKKFKRPPEEIIERLRTSYV